MGVAVPALFGGTQTRPAVTARQLLAYVWVEGVGRRASDLARALGQTRGNISTAARRGAAQAAGGRPRSRGGIATGFRQIMLRNLVTILVTSRLHCQRTMPGAPWR